MVACNEAAAAAEFAHLFHATDDQHASSLACWPPQTGLLLWQICSIFTWDAAARRRSPSSRRAHLRDRLLRHLISYPCSLLGRPVGLGGKLCPVIYCKSLRLLLAACNMPELRIEAGSNSHSEMLICTGCRRKMSSAACAFVGTNQRDPSSYPPAPVCLCWRRALMPCGRLRATSRSC